MIDIPDSASDMEHSRITRERRRFKISSFLIRTTGICIYLCKRRGEKNRHTIVEEEEKCI